MMAKQRRTPKHMKTWLTPPLRLIDATGKQWTIQPPTRKVGLQLAAINAIGVHNAELNAGIETDLDPTILDLLAELDDTPLGELSLGKQTYEQMIATLPGEHVDQLAMYALYYWTLGEQAADAIFEASYGGDDGAPKASKNTPNMASENPMNTDSTPTT